MAKAQLMDYDKALELFEPVLGFEVHVELNTATKMFCGCANEFGSGANTNTCPTCLGLPGGLPQVNEKAIESSIRLGLALGCDIAESSRFARKNYFYPDLAKNFQTSQYGEPIAHDGAVTIELENGRELRIEIERAHMEEDAGKLTHIGGATGRIQGADHSLVDFNRGGVPLVEIVTKMIEGAEGDAPEVGRTYVRAIRDLVKALGVSNARMEEGNVRCDANVSLRRRGSSELGTRTETKNVNSLRSIERAVRYEIQRQAAILEAGGTSSEGYRHAKSLLELEERPTAIFATCDILAAGALQAVYEAGLRVPDDISVIGFDDTIAANLTPQLTTVAQPMEDLGRIGFRAVLAAIETGEFPELPLLPSRLVLRRSTASTAR